MPTDTDVLAGPCVAVEGSSVGLLELQLLSPGGSRRRAGGKALKWEKRAQREGIPTAGFFLRGAGVGGQLISCYLPHVPAFSLNWQKFCPILKSVEQLGPKIKLNQCGFCLISQIPKRLRCGLP